MRARSLLVALLLALVGAAPAVVRADEPALDRAWSAPSLLVPDRQVWDVSIAGLAPGRTIIVHGRREDPFNAIVASVRDAATGFESEQLLAVGSVYEPSLDASFNGGAVAAWLNEEYSAIFVSERRAGASEFVDAFGVETCCNDYGGNRPQVVVGARGDAAIAWLARDDDGDQHVMASYRPVGGDFGDPEDVGVTVTALLQDIALGADGTVALGWDEGGRATVAVRDPAGHWAASETLGPPDGDHGWSSSVLGVDGAGRVAAAWRETAPGADVGAIMLAYRPPGGPFGAPHDTGMTTMGVGSSLQLGVSDAGEVILAAQVDHALPGGGASIDGIWASFGTTVRGDLGPPARLAEMWGQDASLAMSPRGDAVVVWDACCPMVLGARRRLPGGSFGPVVDMAAPIEFTGARGGRIVRQGSIDEAGNAAAAWVDFEPDPDELSVAADGPVITTVPAAVTTVPAVLPPVTKDLGPGPLPSPGVPAPPGAGPPPAQWLPAPGPAATGRALKVKAAPLVVRARVRPKGGRAHRRAEVRVRCSAACSVRVTARLGKTVRLRDVGLRLRRRGEASVRIALPPARRGAHGRTWLAVAVTATGADGRHARTTARVRVPR